MKKNNLVLRIKKYLPKAVAKKLPKEIVIKNITERESRRLNAKYRHKNKSGNVLSFRYSPKYGEILICPAVVRREAKKQANTLDYQMTWMILHGILHLGGMHHEKSRLAEKRAEVIEGKILLKLAKK